MIQTRSGKLGGGTDYPAEFGRLAKECFRGEPSWLRRLRRDALERFGELGFPTTRQEDWRYTSVAPIARTSFVPVACHGPVEVPPLDDCALDDDTMLRLVFVDGRLAPTLSSPRVPPEIRMESLASVLAEQPALLESRLASLAGYERHPFVALNTAFFTDGAFLRIPKDFVLREPVQILFVATRSERPRGLHPRVLILLEEHSRATVVESHVAPEGGTYFANAVTEVLAGPGAALDHYKWQEESPQASHVATTEVSLGRDARLRSHYLSFGAALVRNAVGVVFGGPGGHASLNGLYVANGSRHADCQTRVDHAAPHCGSDQSYRGILDGAARGVFNGRVIVREGAQKTDARQSNKNLVLSRRAVADTKPQLEIHADDVKCSHGASIGRLDESSVFYLRSRGIDERAARMVLTRGFASEITRGIRVEPLLRRADRLLSRDFSIEGVEALSEIEAS